MKLITILLGVCLLVLCNAPVHALFAGDDVVNDWWCPAGLILDDMFDDNILANDIPNSPPIIPVLVEDAKNGSVILHPDGRVTYDPDYEWLDIILAGDSFRYRTFDGQDYSNVATVRIRLWPPSDRVAITDGESLKFSTQKDTMLSAQLRYESDEWGFGFLTADYRGPGHGTLIYNYDSPDFQYIPDPGFEGIDRVEYRIGRDTVECGIMFGMPGTIEITVGNPNPVPEFPSTVLPAIFVIGFLGAVLLIRRTRES